jgi:hypothetical protein
MKFPYTFIQYLLISTIIFVSLNAYNQVIIGESSQSTATERNNARLIAYDLAGNLHIVYYNNGIYHSILYKNCDEWTMPYLITGIGRNPSIAIDNDNVLHLVFKSGGVNAYDIAHYTYNDNEWNNMGILYNNTSHFSSRPVIAVDSNNNLHCVWQVSKYSGYANSEILYKKYSSISGWDINPTLISKTIGASEYPTLTINSYGNIFVVWKDSEETTFYPKRVLMKKYVAGDGWDDDYSIICETSIEDQYATMDPSVITDSNDNIHLVWKDNHLENSNTIYYKKFNQTYWADAVAVSEGNFNSTVPIIGIDNSGNINIVWSERNSNYYFEILSRKYNPVSDFWEQIVNVSETPSQDSRNPNIPVSLKNSLAVMWTEGDANPYNIVAKIFTASLLLGDVNNDGFVNVMDVVWLVSHLNGNTPVGFVMENADVNEDNIINVADLTLLVDIILNKS